MGHLMLQGVPPYQLAYSIKLPGVRCPPMPFSWQFRTDCRGGSPGSADDQPGCHVLEYSCACEIPLRRAYARQPIASAVYALMSISPAMVGFDSSPRTLILSFSRPWVGFWCLLRGLKSALLRPSSLADFCLHGIYDEAAWRLFGVWAGLALICARGSPGPTYG